MKEIYHCLKIKASLDKVFRALTEKAGLAGWWTMSLDHRGAVGSISTFRFSSGAFNKMKIVRVEPYLIEWLCINGHPQWKETQIRFELHSHGNDTEVHFSHFGFKDQTPYVGSCSFIWAQYLLSLQGYCQSGHGNPDKGVR